MKKLIPFILLLQSIVVRSQQNFINVPSSEATKAKGLFFQQQLNFNEIIQSNTTLDFGLGKGFEIGANVLGLNFNSRKNSFLNNDTSDVDPYNPLVCINGLKQFKISENFSISSGAQVGLNFTRGKETAQAYLAYTNLLFENLILEGTKLVGGAYFNSLHYGGKGNRFGGWLATEIPVFKKWHVMAESILGYNSISYTSLGIIFYATPHIPLTLGYQIPNTRKNSYALVFELTFVP